VPEQPLTPVEQVAIAASAIDGWLSEAQGRALYAAAAATTGRGAIVEIGSWKGRSTVWLAAGARAAGRRIYAVDPHRGSHEDPAANTFAEFIENIRRAGVADAIEPLVMTSAEAASRVREPVELLFVDGDHTREGSERDADTWLPRLVTGGQLMMHDVGAAGYLGPRTVFRRRVCWNSGFDRIGRVGSMGVARRTERRGPAAALWGGVAGILLYLYDVKRWLGGWRRDYSTEIR
jgi:predicted O-methyltransferase YrrM